MKTEAEEEEEEEEEEEQPGAGDDGDRGEMSPQPPAQCSARDFVIFRYILPTSQPEPVCSYPFPAHQLSYLVTRENKQQNGSRGGEEKNSQSCKV